MENEKTATEGEAMGKKLKAAGKKAETQKTERRERTVKGSHLLGALQSKAKDAGLTVMEKSGFLKVTGAAKGRAVYVARKGGRVDLNGFTVVAAAVTQVSEEDARQKHLGKVRGQLDFTQDDETVLAAYDAALGMLQEVQPETVKAAAKTKKAKAPEATEAPVAE